MSEVPPDEILWKIAHIRDEGYCNSHSIACFEAAAEQLRWDDLAAWIEREIRRSPRREDGEKWIRTLKLAVGTHGDGYDGAMALDAGGAMFFDE